MPIGRDQHASIQYAHASYLGESAVPRSLAGVGRVGAIPVLQDVPPLADRMPPDGRAHEQFAFHVDGAGANHPSNSAASAHRLTYATTNKI